MNKTKIFLAILAVLAIFVAGCETQNDGNWTDYNFSLGLDDYEPNATLINESVVNETNLAGQEPEKIDEGKASFTIDATEGDLVKIPITAVDPDGDFLEYDFEKPFNDKGLWQTEIGDEGKYLIEIEVTDGKLSTTEFVLVVINRANRPPTIECPDKVSVKEGETVRLDCNIYDVDGDVVIVGYDGWMKTSSYKTTFDDEGKYTVLVRAKDKDHESFKEMTVEVKNTNRAPIIQDIDVQEVMEEDSLLVDVSVVDPDGDDVVLTFSKPLDENGAWTPTYGDRGNYNVTVVASDGETEEKATFELEVLRLNRAPVIKPMKDIEVFEGEKVKLDVETFDPDGDDVVIVYDGWMDSSEYTTTFDDANPNGCNVKGCSAEYKVTVSVSDGTLSSTQNVVVKVTDKNRPPVFVYEE
ncbi:hypothetical protein K9L67_04675 [Candidatus Woesearchaeota archaeon]|nr:hypothetical protein [Candidatus Woesearchaeota archaeon]MCF7901494.1 hypothetical protein [Candidatus Woesearchaeota archaeon]MCF8013916.1 hypothetical protein [Candidatus Woesearchaeota archaeon]